MANGTTVKTCTRCGESKPIDEFYLSRGKPRSSCKSCTLKSNADWRSRNPDVVAEGKRRWARENRDKVLANQRAYRDANRDKYTAYQAEYYQANRERIDRVNRMWAQNNIDKHREYHREYVKRPEQRERHAEYMLRYSQTDAYRASRFKRKQARRAAIAAASTAEFTPQDLIKRIEYYGGKCWMCGDPYEHIDHVKPISKGGLNILANLRPACAPCNLSKHARWPIPEVVVNRERRRI